ncbi:MAG: ribbon-helix-helix protein, CopG family [Gemmatimonadaceae bacterium]|nr:ribbon-helix-helix protein, CopG family [Gemmatimonadaceae bacterium]
MTGRPKVRLTFEVTPELSARLDALAESTGSTRTDVFRKAIALFDIAVEARANDERLGVLSKDRALKREIVGL